MSQFATLSGIRIVAGSIAIPLYGMWAGDVSLATTDTVPDDVPLVLGNLTLTGHVYRQAAFGGERRCRLVAGFGGWRKQVDPKQYSLSGGVQLSMVLNDAAIEVGEKVNVPNDVTIGTGYVREGATASRVLRQLAGENWYIDPDGVTQIQAWPAKAAVGSDFTVISQDGGEGRVVIATEDYASFLPGCTFKGPTLDSTFTNCGVLYRFADDGTFRLEVLTS